MAAVRMRRSTWIKLLLSAGSPPRRPAPGRRRRRQGVQVPLAVARRVMIAAAVQSDGPVREAVTMLLLLTEAQAQRQVAAARGR